MYPLLQGKAKHFQKVASYSSNAMFTSPIVTSSVTRLLDDVFAGTGDEGELIGDMALYLFLYERALKVPLLQGKAKQVYYKRDNIQRTKKKGRNDKMV